MSSISLPLVHLDSKNYKVFVSSQEIEIAKENWSQRKTLFGCGEEFERLAFTLMLDNNLQYPETVTESTELFETLIDLITEAENN